eukprot:GILJ01005572.1.p1 GENE.GILJ01005572.1~~GILJ01005572.1.p1  ORF type:complete len:285 (-),score=42.80 GILJ01005572.1:218-1072(-)
MVRYAQLVMGPAGCGKSTFCKIMQEHAEANRRTIRVVNLDPAAETFNYTHILDVRDLISLEDVMEELKYGPNGGLVYCMEYLNENLEWLKEELEDFAEDEYFLFDCPGQIELYSHIPVMRNMVDALQQWGFSVCGVYCIDSLFMTEPSKFISGALMALSAMVQLELPHMNVLTKCDLVQNQSELEKFMDPDIPSLVTELNKDVGPKFWKLNESMGQLIDDYNMVSFAALNVKDEETINLVLSQIDHAIQYGEDLEPKVPRDDDVDEEENEVEEREYNGYDDDDS